MPIDVLLGSNFVYRYSPYESTKTIVRFMLNGERIRPNRLNYATEKYPSIMVSQVGSLKEPREEIEREL